MIVTFTDGSTIEARDMRTIAQYVAEYGLLVKEVTVEAGCMSGALIELCDPRDVISTFGVSYPYKLPLTRYRSKL